MLGSLILTYLISDDVKGARTRTELIVQTISSRTTRRTNVDDEESEYPRATADAFSLTVKIPAHRGGVLGASARQDLEHEVDVYWMRTCSESTKCATSCWYRWRMSYFFFWKSWIFVCWCSQEQRPELQLRVSCCHDFLTWPEGRYVRACTQKWQRDWQWMFDTPAAERSFFVDCQNSVTNWYRKVGWVCVPRVPYGCSNGNDILMTEHVSLTTVTTLASGYVSGSDHYGYDWRHVDFDGRAGEYYVTWVHGHSVVKNDHIAACPLETRRKIVSLCGFAREEGLDSRSDWNFSDKIAAKVTVDVERHDVFVDGGDSHKMKQIARRWNGQSNTRDSWWSEM